MQIDPNKVTWDDAAPFPAPAPAAPAPQSRNDPAMVPWDAPNPAAGAAASPKALAPTIDPSRVQWDAPAPEAAPAAPQPRSFGQEAGRQLGLTARHAINGVAALPAMAADAVGGLANAGLDLVRGEGNGFRFPKQADALNSALTHAGLPQPENALERVVGDATSAVAGAGGTIALGAKLAGNATSGVTQAVGNALAAEPVLQAASAAAGAGASGAAREAGGGEGAQLAAGLLGTVAPAVATAPMRRVLAPEGTQLRAAAQQMHDTGYVIPPAELTSGPVTSTLSAIGGQVKMNQAASARNQTLSDKLARRSVGLGEDAELSVDTLEGIRRNAAAAYEPVAASGTVTPGRAYASALDRALAPFTQQSKSFPGTREPQVVADLQALRSPQFDAGDAMTMIRSMRESADRAYRSGENMAGKAYRQGAAALEDALEGHLKQMGQPAAEILEGFRDARQLIAKTYSVQSALTRSGSIDALKLGAALSKGRPLSGELRTIAEAGRAFPRAMQALKEGPKANSALDAVTALGTGLVTGSPLALGMLAARPTARSILLSGVQQRQAIKDAGMSTQRVPDSAGAIAAQGAARTGDGEPPSDRLYRNQMEAAYDARAAGRRVVPVQGGWVVR